jgi:hypothetical protein
MYIRIENINFTTYAMKRTQQNAHFEVVLIFHYSMRTVCPVHLIFLYLICLAILIVKYSFEALLHVITSVLFIGSKYSQHFIRIPCFRLEEEPNLYTRLKHRYIHSVVYFNLGVFK